MPPVQYSGFCKKYKAENDEFCKKTKAENSGFCKKYKAEALLQRL